MAIVSVPIMSTKIRPIQGSTFLMFTQSSHNPLLSLIVYRCKYLSKYLSEYGGWNGCILKTLGVVVTEWKRITWKIFSKESKKCIKVASMS